MRDDNISRIISLTATVLVAVGLFLFLYLCPVSVDGKDPDSAKKGEIALLTEEMEEEFVDVLDPAPAGGNAESDDPAHLDQPQITESQAARQGGTDVYDQGRQGDPPPTLVSNQPSPIKHKNDETKQNPGQAQNTQSEDPNVKSKAQSDVAGKLNKGKNNANTSETADNGASGANTRHTGTAVMSGLQGTGWQFPRYNAVISPVSGSVTATVKIDAQGNVTSIIITGGTPPAASNATVCAAVKRELSRKFTRANYADAQPATAYITYTFR